MSNQHTCPHCGQALELPIEDAVVEEVIQEVVNADEPAQLDTLVAQATPLVIKAVMEKIKPLLEKIQEAALQQKEEAENIKTQQQQGSPNQQFTQQVQNMLKARLGNIEQSRLNKLRRPRSRYKRT